MFQPQVWPSLGKQEQEYNFGVLQLYFNSCSHNSEDGHKWLIHFGDCYVVKLHSYIQVHLLDFLKNFICLINAQNMEHIKLTSMWVHRCGGGGACQRVNIFNTKTELGYGMHLEHLILIHTVYLIMPVV
jgi:hypothetical protein